jgi:hypothetical protein
VAPDFLRGGLPSNVGANVNDFNLASWPGFRALVSLARHITL